VVGVHPLSGGMGAGCWYPWFFFQPLAVPSCIAMLVPPPTHQPVPTSALSFLHTPHSHPTHLAPRPCCRQRRLLFRCIPSSLLTHPTHLAPCSRCRQRRLALRCISQAVAALVSQALNGRAHALHCICTCRVGKDSAVSMLGSACRAGSSDACSVVCKEQRRAVLPFLPTLFQPYPTLSPVRHAPCASLPPCVL